MARTTGKVKTLKEKFGFIRSDSGAKYFFHGGALDKMSGLKLEDLQPGDRVEFDPAEHDGGKGPRALLVRKLS